MAGPVRLKGEFDNRLRNAGNNLRKIQTKLLQERAGPKTWSAEQVEDLYDSLNAINDVQQAVAEMAARVRVD